MKLFLSVILSLFVTTAVMAETYRCPAGNIVTSGTEVKLVNWDGKKTPLLGKIVSHNADTIVIKLASGGKITLTDKGVNYKGELQYKYDFGDYWEARKDYCYLVSAR
jgi:hypothetical protein